jgi:hypothetical protein
MSTILNLDAGLGKRLFHGRGKAPAGEWYPNQGPVFVVAELAGLLVAIRRES